MNEALVAAQQLRADAQAQAARDAEQVLKEARADAARIVERSQAEEHAIQQRTEAVGRQFVAYVHNFRALLDRHQVELAGLEAYLDQSADRPDGAA
jgi:hypothetical protein